MKEKSKHQIDMTEGSLLTNIVLFSIPLIITNMLQLLYNAADMIVVGQFAGPQALSAVGSTGALTHLIVTCFMGLSVGAGVRISRSFGAKDFEGIEKTLHTALLVSVLSGVFLMVVGFFIARPMLTLMGTPYDVIDGATIYMQIFFMGMPFNLLYNFGAAMLRAVGDTKRPLKFLGIAGIVNVLLNLVFVIGFNMSVVGVALATIVAQAISAVFVVRCFLQNDGILDLDFKKLKIHKRQLWDIVRIGLPAGLQGAMFSIANVTVQSAINSFGSIATAGNVASANVEGFLFMGMNCISQAALTSAAQNVGAEKYKRMRQSLYYSWGVVVAVGVFLGTMAFVFAEPIISLYNSDPEVIVIGVQRLRILSMPYFIFGIMDVMIGQLRGLGISLIPTIISFCGVCMVRILWVFFVFPQFNNLEIIYWSFPISWTIAAIAKIILYRVVLTKLPKDNIQRI